MSAYNPSIPVDNSLIDAEELRDQFNSLKALCDALSAQCDSLSLALTNKVDVPSVTTLSQTISSPPTQAQVTAVQNKLNELIVHLEP